METRGRKGAGMTTAEEAPGASRRKGGVGRVDDDDDGRRSREEATRQVDVRRWHRHHRMRGLIEIRLPPSRLPTPADNVCVC